MVYRLGQNTLQKCRQNPAQTTAKHKERSLSAQWDGERSFILLIESLCQTGNMLERRRRANDGKDVQSHSWQQSAYTMPSLFTAQHVMATLIQKYNEVNSQSLSCSSALCPNSMVCILISLYCVLLYYLLTFISKQSIYGFASLRVLSMGKYCLLSGVFCCSCHQLEMLLR